MLLVVLIVVTVVWDYRWNRIPNAITIPVMLIGLVFGALEGFPGELMTGGFVDHLAAVLIAFAFSYSVYQFGGMKAGDAKFLMALAATRGLPFFIVAGVYGILLGGLVAGATIAVRGLGIVGPRVPVRTSMKSWMPYGVSLAVGAAIALALDVTNVMKVGAS